MRTTGAAQNVTRLTQSPEDEIRPALSPDGKVLAYQLLKGTQYDLFTIDPKSGMARTQVTNHPANDVDPAWTPDSRHIVFSSDRLGRYRVWRQLAAGGGGTTMITSGADMVAFSPTVANDGKTICFASTGVGDARATMIVTQAKAGKTVVEKQLPHLWMVGVDGNQLTQFGEGVSPAWAPDSKRIAYASDASGNWDVWMMETSGSGVTQLSADPRDQTDPCFSPDGQWIAYVSNQGGNSDLWIMKVDGSAPTQITQDSGEEINPCWGSDGNLYFCSNKSGNWDIWRLTPVIPS